MSLTAPLARSRPVVSRAGFAVQAALASRALVWTVAIAAVAVFGANPSVRASLDLPHLTQPFGSHALNFIVAPGARYDSVWYLAIAHNGYFSPQSTAFFPLLPLLLAGGGVLLGSTLAAGVLISLIASVAAFVLLYRLALLDLSEHAARTSVLLLALFPAALFLSAIYTEALFLALSLGAILAARRERWVWAGLLGACAGATRSTGLLLLVPLGLILLEQRRQGRSVRETLPWLALVPAGVMSYMAYLAVKHGQPLAPFHAESFWHREFAGPFGAVFHALLALPVSIRWVLEGRQTPFSTGTPFGWQAYQLIDLPFLAFAVAGMWFSWRRLPRAYSAYALVVLAEALSYPVALEPMKSLSRYLVVIFPLFLGWGAVLAEHPRARRITLAVSGLGLIGYSVLWGIWAWVA